jgi:hypothetical protein
VFLRAFLMKLATVSEGWAPTLIQCSARSNFMEKLSSFFNGWYVPISSMNFPSRGLRQSATTMRKTGVFFVPIRFKRILTAIIFCKSEQNSLPARTSQMQVNQKEW